MICIVRTFGAPVIEAAGKRARNISASEAAFPRPPGEVICQHRGIRLHVEGGNYVYASRRAMRPRSLRTMSTIMAFSARSLTDAANAAHAATSAAWVSPRGGALHG